MAQLVAGAFSHVSAMRAGLESDRAARGILKSQMYLVDSALSRIYHSIGICIGTGIDIGTDMHVHTRCTQ